jgi:general secretion pathway protein D
MQVNRPSIAAVLFLLAVPCIGWTAGASAGQDAADEAQPRIIRGNDIVVAPSKARPAIQGPASSFRFEEAPIAEVVRTMLGDIVKVDYVLHPPLNGSITLATRTAVPPDQAIFLLEAALQANGLAMVQDARGSYHVGRADMLKGLGMSVRQAGSGGTLPPGSGAVLVPLQFIGAGEMASILRPMLPGDAILRVDTVRNLLVLAGTRTQAESWIELVNTFDVDLLKGMSVGVFPLKHVNVKEVEAALQLMSGGIPAAGAQGRGAGQSATVTAPAARPGAGAGAVSAAPVTLGEGNPLFGALRIMPIERINSILVVTPRAAYLEEARRWIEKLDQPGGGADEPQLFIYEVQNGNARHLAGVLSGIFGGTTGTPGVNSGVAPGLSSASASSWGAGGGQWNSGGGNFNRGQGFGGSGSGFGGAGMAGGAAFGARQGGLAIGSNNVGAPGQGAGSAVGGTVTATLGNIRVMADELNNSVLIWGTKSEYAKIQATLKRLDLPPTQVLIEASIIEVTLNDGLEYGLEWSFKDGRPTTDYSGTGTLFAGGSGRTPLSPLASGFSYALKNPTGQVTAMLRALSNKTSVKMIASPTLMVLDNHTAAIAVGNQTPVLAGTITSLENSATTQSNYQYKDTGVNLTVTPSVNAGNLVTMQVDQSVTDVGAADEVTGQRSFLQRQMASKVAVRSGESIVMGGLIQDRATQAKSGVPLLHSLPLVGNLFGSTNRDSVRTELVVVITPRVVRSDIDIREVSEDLRDRMKGLSAFEALGSGTTGRRDSPIPGQPQPSR